MQPSIENVKGKPLTYPDWLDDVWAKSAELGEGGQPETLAQHTWSVLSRLAEFIQLRPNLPTQLNVPRLWHILFWSAFLHDFGKAIEGFQTQLRPDGNRWGHRHEVFSLAFVDWVTDDLSAEEQLWLVASIVSHHRDFEEIQRLYPVPDWDDDDPLHPQLASLSESTLGGLWRWLSECGIPWRDELGLSDFGISMPKLQAQDIAFESVQQHGVERIRHWLRVYRKLNRDLEDRDAPHAVVPGITIRGYIINADHSASAHAGPIPLAQFDADTILASRNLSREGLFGHQSQAEKVDGSALLVAPTGSGKTEAALIWAARQSSIIGRLPRLFYTLPYQASMNAMQGRLEESFPQRVGLQHGRSLLALYRLLLEKDYHPKAAARTAKWARNLSRLNYPPVRVFSPYQMLKGMYRLKGYEALLTDYHNATFIFDEIHAYEVKRLAMILKTIEYLRVNFNARFFIMSATFPTLIQDWLSEALNAPTKIEADPALFQKFVRHQLILHDGELLTDSGLTNVINDAKAGKSVLVVCNLVDHAQEAYDRIRNQLSAMNIRTELLHGRFNMRDRSAKEQLIREKTGATSDKRQPIVLVATQVVEVSLDIDLDTIYTEPAPLEALVQRFGRINRRRKQKGLAPVHVFRQPDDGQKIYDPELVQRTLAILEREHEHPIDESAIGAWLDEIYSGEVAVRWREEYETAADNFNATCVRTMRPFATDEGLEEMFYKAFDGLEVLPASLYDEYKAVSDEEPIRAGELLVSISWGRFHALRNSGKVLPRNGREPYRITAAYDSAVGLTFD